MYTLQALPYDYDALEPFIDTHTIGLHYKKHQQNYLNELNRILKQTTYDYQYSIEDLALHIHEFPEKERESILFNLGGVLNHNIYFRSMAKEKTPMSKSFEKKVIDTFGSIENWKKEWKEKALALKGSGYVFLVEEHGELKLVPFKNQDTPYKYQMKPLLALDMWEHAYYLNYQNNKGLYIDNFFEALDYKYANQQFENKK